VELDNRPGQLARIAEAIGAKGINITAGGGLAWGSKGAFGFLTNDEAGTLRTLRDIKCSFHALEVVLTSVADEPGALGKLARRLADAGVHIELLVATGSADGNVTLAIGVDDAEAARAALGGKAITMA
jgi:hypothetical protein